MIWVYTASFLLLSLFSFTQIDLNLTLYNSNLLLPILNFLKNIGYRQRTLSAVIFIILATSLYFNYLKLVYKQKTSKKHLKIVLLVTFLAGILAYPMFSHDIFNYLFNAKMVIIYHSNPHTHTAVEFATDAWTRFMHNTHTPAPYGYAWTGISLLPVYLGLPSFTLSLWFTKTLISTFFLLEIFFFTKIAKIVHKKDSLNRVIALGLNPLILMETFIIGHNDSIMMFFIFLSFYLLETNKTTKNKFISLLSFIASVFIKYATVVLAPVLLLKNKIKDIYATSGSILLVILLSRPGQLNSWYLHWGIAFLLLSKSKKLVKLGILLSIGGMLRYLPYIYFGHWDFPVTIIRWVLLLAPLIFLIPIKTIYEKITSK